ncbi:MAG: proline iminopeptidase-family hydrolase [Bdellovibrionales bacterium]|nr:proline iminopeptidase-family hydrolase [Bdellovibrionales bacterium]
MSTPTFKVGSEYNEGYVPVPGGRVWYRVHGTAEATPLVVIHGGPGYPHDYLEPLAALAQDRPVVFYDQLGCGRSERPDNPSLWTVERAVLELDALRKHLKLRRVHLYGHSWGSMVAVDYALTWPDGLESLILASPCISIPRWIEDAAKLREALPEEVRQVLDDCEARGDLAAPEYLRATLEYYRHYVCRLDPKPACVVRSDNGAGAEVYTTMWGPNEFYLTGVLKDYDRSDRLGDLTVPILYTCGAFDEARPDTTNWYHSQSPNAAVAVFQQSSHIPHLEEQDTYLSVLNQFLKAVEHGDAIPGLVWTHRTSESRLFFTLLWFGFLLVVFFFALSRGC